MLEDGHSDTRGRDILPRQVEILYDNSAVMLVANVVSAGLVTVVLGSDLGRTVYLWCAAVVVSAVICALLVLAIVLISAAIAPLLPIDPYKSNFGARLQPPARSGEGALDDLAVARAIGVFV